MDLVGAISIGVDLFAVGAIVLCVIFGVYRGFSVTGLKTCSFFISWIFAILLYPVVSRALGTEDFVQSVINYTEGWSKVAHVTAGDDITQTLVEISKLTPAEMSSIVDVSRLVHPYDSITYQTMSTGAFASMGLVTVGEYFNYSVAHATIHILSFLMLFLGMRLLLGVIINAWDYKKPLPVLKHYDPLVGGIVGFLHGFFLCYVIFAALPPILTVLGITQLDDAVANSGVASFFYQSNFILSYFGGIL